MPAKGFWTEWLKGEENPDILYPILRPQTGAPGFLDYWRRQQRNVWGDYLGALGKGMKADIEPTMSFYDFLRDYPWLQQYLGLAPEARGERMSQFSPRMRWSL